MFRSHYQVYHSRRFSKFLRFVRLENENVVGDFHVGVKQALL
jgi:hypothetical protein